MKKNKFFSLIAVAALGMAASLSSANAATVKDQIGLRYVSEIKWNTTPKDGFFRVLETRKLRGTTDVKNDQIEVGFRSRFITKTGPVSSQFVTSFTVRDVFDLFDPQTTAIGNLDEPIRFDQTVGTASGAFITFNPDQTVTCAGDCEVGDLGFDLIDGTYSVSIVPLPASGLLLLGPLGLMFAGRRKSA